ncbi:hypothetical protein BDEG_21432 [Batrachochytrium dendrobatidis JEL423]|uniref:Uncharacterized protein n=1 Tax=Batrachochytrium dendrobatidis (strain JEL423) TaxID=403673 RepID=A0A177WDE4_BATDL|nr:hypothetical protein BDEG_21432 [Batrachochytrium dendrobatidis JEL423]
MHRSMSNICVSATKLQSMTHPHDPTCQIMYHESKIDQKPDHAYQSQYMHGIALQSLDDNWLQCDTDRHTSAWCDVTMIMVECVGVDIASQVTTNQQPDPVRT